MEKVELTFDASMILAPRTASSPSLATRFFSSSTLLADDARWFERAVASCGCDEEGCLSVYVAAARGAPCGDTYRVVMPDAVVTIGVCAEQIEYIEDGVLREADDTPDRRREYRALEGTVPTRLPTDL